MHNRRIGFAQHPSRAVPSMAMTLSPMENSADSWPTATTTPAASNPSGEDDTIEEIDVGQLLPEGG